MAVAAGLLHREGSISTAPVAEQVLVDARHRRARWSAAANLLSKCCGMLVTLATVQFTLPYLGPERFGGWMLLASLIAMLSFLDLGMGNALTNRVAQVAAHDKSATLQATIGGGLLALLGIAALAGVTLWIAGSLVPWNWLLRSNSETLAAEAQRASSVFAICFAAVLFSGGLQKVFLGLQRSYESHLAVAASSLLSLILLYAASQSRAGIPVLLATAAAGQLLTVAILLAVLARRRLVSMSSALAHVREEAPVLMRVGGLFLVLQVGTMIGWGADSLIIGSTLGAAEVAIYAVTQRLFMFATMPAALLNQPLWGAYADAHARGENGYVARTLRRSLLTTLLLTGTLAAILVVLKDPLIGSWTGQSISVPISFMLTFAIWSVIESVATAAAMYMNGCNIIRPQVWAVAVFCVISLPLKFVLARQFGLVGVVGCTIIAYLIAVPLMYSLFFRHEVGAPLRRNRP